MLIGFFIGAAAMGALWWYVDSHGGAAAVEAQAIAKAKADAAGLEVKIGDAAKAEVAKVEAKL